MLKIKINASSCSGCAICVDCCPVPVIKYNEDKKLPEIINSEGCLLCRTCEELCPTGSFVIDYPDYDLRFVLEGVF